MIVLDPEWNGPIPNTQMRDGHPVIHLRMLEHFAARARSAAGLRGDVNILITSSRTLRTLNRRFRKIDKATDVLSFPPALAGGYAGDIAISGEIAARQSQALGHSLVQELKVLILHGMLHLAGYDHETDDGEMARKEERLRRQLGLSTSLIQRSGILRGSLPRASRRTAVARDKRP